MVKKDKEYKRVENITLICYATGLVLTCLTKFLPFIFLTIMTYPISFYLINREWRKSRSCKTK